ncbi:helix-turn-helix domain-containing protein [Nostoc sp. CCCryo 231-06]|nr:helix-turn-helix domain-containing protein [Nostoc sp. CCCryo 231-06]
MNTTRDRNNFLPVVPSYFDEYGLDAMEFRLYSHIVRRAGKEGCFESIPNMARSCLMNEKTVRKALRVLVAARLVKIVQERKGKTSIYQLTHPSEWVNPQNLPAIRQEFTTNLVNQNLAQHDSTCSKFGRSSGSKSGVSTGSNNARGVVPDLAGVVVPNQEGVLVPDLVDKVYPNKEFPSKEFPLSAVPPNQNALSTQKSCVCETEQLNLEKPTSEKPSLEKSTPEEPTPQLPASLSKNSESSQQTDNPSRGSTIAAGSFEKSEQSNKPQLSCPYKTAQNVKELIDAWLTDPTAMSDDCVPLLVRDSIKWNCWVLPWRNGERKLNNLYQNFNPIVVDFLAQELATKSKLSAQQEITHAIAVMNTWEKTKGGWTNLMQRYHQAVLQTQKQPLPQLHTATTKRPSNTTSITLEDALAQDHKRRQQEQSIRVPSNEYQHSPQMLELKAKLQAAANAPKVPSNTRPSSMNLREVEAQLKLALRA